MTARGHAAAFAVLFGGLGLAFFVLNAQHAYHPTDDGFVLAYAWRLVNGEVPYRDFLCVRTPLTLYLHLPELLLPEGWQIQAGRFVFYLELALAGALPTAWAALRCGLRATPRALALAAIFFLFTLHNFPPMPWPTVDAVAFSSAAATAFLFSLEATARRALVLCAATSILLTLAVLAKQTFAPLPVLLVAFALVEAVHARTWRRFAASTLPGALIGLGTLTALALAGALEPFLRQIAQPAQLRPSVAIPWSGDVLSGGLEPYVRALSPISAAFMLAAFALVRSRGPRASLVRKAGSLGVFAAFAALAVEAQLDVFSAGRHLFLVLAAAGGAELLGSLDRRDRLTVAAYASVLAVAWCASLSFAYQTPLLGLAAGGMLLERAFGRAHWPAERLAVALAVAFVLAGVIRLDLDRPYRDLPREAQVADLGDVYPRFGHLHTNQANYERFVELRDLIERSAPDSGRGFVVMPDYPLIHFLSGTRNPLSIDWLQPQEYLGNEGRLERELRERRPLVLVQRDASLTVGPAEEPPHPCDRPPEPASSLVVEVTSRWVLLAEGRHFCVYRPP